MQLDNDLTTGLQALTLSATRIMACMTFNPAFGRRHMTMLCRNSVVIAFSMPEAALLWVQLPPHGLGWNIMMLLTLKEAALGTLIGLVTATPFWAMRGMGTIIDNQRGGNAAQIMNPSLEADASVLGELVERCFVVYLGATGLSLLFYTTIYQSFAAWPPTVFAPALSVAQFASIVATLSGVAMDALLYAGPILILLLIVEASFGMIGGAVKGIDVASLAVPLKSLLSLLLLALYLPVLLHHVCSDSLPRWMETLRHLGLVGI